jgi:biopolymer transport protein ExbD
MMAFGGFQQEGQAAPMSEINTTPLVDVMLVLLIIFIITAPLLTHAVKVDLPKTDSQVQEEKPETISLSLNAAGDLFWNSERIAEAELPARLAAAAGRTPQPELHLRADRDTRYQKLANLMAAARAAGIIKLGFVTEPPIER